jgi:antitoxin (DNA-binding transcriptional repressor) of toxin-antitoxin stability system
MLGLFVGGTLVRARYNFGMKTMTTAKFKAEFASVVAELKSGHEVVITYGRKKEPLATIVPQSKMSKPNYAIKLGDLRHKGWSYKTKDFEMTDEDLLAGS